MWKKHKIVVLPSEYGSIIGKQLSNNEYFFNPEITCKSGLAEPCNLFVLSDEEIKELS